MFICEDNHTEQNVYHELVFVIELIFTRISSTLEGTGGMLTFGQACTLLGETCLEKWIE